MVTTRVLPWLAQSITQNGIAPALRELSERERGNQDVFYLTQVLLGGLEKEHASFDPLRIVEVDYERLQTFEQYFAWKSQKEPAQDVLMLLFTVLRRSQLDHHGMLEAFAALHQELNPAFFCLLHIEVGAGSWWIHGMSMARTVNGISTGKLGGHGVNLAREHRRDGFYQDECFQDTKGLKEDIATTIKHATGARLFPDCNCAESAPLRLVTLLLHPYDITVYAISTITWGLKPSCLRDTINYVLLTQHHNVEHITSVLQEEDVESQRELLRRIKDEFQEREEARICVDMFAKVEIRQALPKDPDLTSRKPEGGS